MRFRFVSKKLEALYVHGYRSSESRKYSNALVDSFFLVMQIIRGATDERTFRAFKSLHYEKLKGERRGQHSLRLVGPFRLEIETDLEGKLLAIISIEDYHK